MPPNPKLADCRVFGVASAVASLSFSSDGKLLAVGLVSAESPERVLILDVERGKQTQLLNIVGQQVAGTPIVRFSPAGGLLAIARGSGGVAIWNTLTWKQEHVFDSERGLPPLALDFSSDGRLLALGGYARHVLVWDVVNRKLVATLKGHARRTKSVAFSALAGGGRYLFTSGGDRTVNLWNIPTRGSADYLFDDGKLERLLELAFPETSIDAVFCWPAGRDFAVLKAGQPLRRWSVSKPVVTDNPTEILDTTFPRTGSTAALSDDGKVIALSSFRESYQVGVYGVDDGQQLAVLKGVSPDVIAFRPRSHTLAIARGIVEDAPILHAPRYHPENLILWQLKLKLTARNR